MGNLVFQATSGGTTTLAADDTSTINQIAVPAKNGVLAISNSTTGALTMPAGTTAQRPVSPNAGDIRLNTTTGAPEWWNPTTSSWLPFSVGTAAYTISYLAVAAGGGGSYGGGGAGGMLEGLATITPGQTYAIDIGVGGTGSTTAPTNGGDTIAAGIASATGGGKGSTYYAAAGAGGSGGGGAGSYVGGIGVIGQGHNGGAGAVNGGAGGGGAAAQGQDAPANGAGYGGAGLPSSISGSTTYYAGGGAGVGNGSPSTAAGGVGGGGASGATTGTAGTANTGGGGGGAGTTPGNGGSGIFIIAYPGTPRASGGTITQVGGNTIHTFTASGTLIG